ADTTANLTTLTKTAKEIDTNFISYSLSVCHLGSHARSFASNHESEAAQENTSADTSDFTEIIGEVIIEGTVKVVIRYRKRGMTFPGGPLRAPVGHGYWRLRRS